MVFRHFFTTPRTINECAAFLATLQCALGCSALWPVGQGRRVYVHNHCTRLYSLLLAITLVCTLATALINMFNDTACMELLLQLDAMLLAMVGLEIIISMLVYLITVGSMRRQVQQQQRIYQLLQALDVRITRQFATRLAHHQLARKSSIIFVIIWCVHCIPMVSVLVFAYRKSLWWLTAVVLSYSLANAGIHVSGYMHMLLAEMLRIRLKLLHTLMAREHLERRYASAERRANCINDCVEIFKQLHLTINVINGAYQASLLASLGHDFTLSTSVLYIFVNCTLDHRPGQMCPRLLSYLLLYMLLPLYKMITAPLRCEAVEREARHFLDLLQDIDTWFDTKERANARLVQHMMLWRRQKHFQFTLGMNICMRRSLITVVVLVIIKYLFIVIQFRMSQEASYAQHAS